MSIEHSTTAGSQKLRDPAPISIMIRNYRDGIRKVLSSGNNDGTQPQGNEYDLLIEIDAPEQLPVSESAMQIYLDPGCSPPRSLNGKAWQVRSAQEMDAVDFSLWALEVANLLARLVLEQGLVCVDLIDLALVFNQGIQPFNCLLCDWPDPCRLPDVLQRKAFTHGLWVVFARPEQLDATLFGKAGTLFDEVMSAEGMHLAAGRLQSAYTARLLLIGV